MVSSARLSPTLQLWRYITLSLASRKLRLVSEPKVNRDADLRPFRSLFSRQTGWPMGVRPVPVVMDDFGMIPEALEKLLAEWDDIKQGRRRPRVMCEFGSLVRSHQTVLIFSVPLSHRRHHHNRSKPHWNRSPGRSKASDLQNRVQVRREFLSFPFFSLLPLSDPPSLLVCE